MLLRSKIAVFLITQTVMTFHERAVGSPVANESGLGAAKDLEREFARAFPAAEFNGARLNDTLREAIHRFVDEAKARGTSASEVVIAMKEVARRAGFSRPDSARAMASFPPDRLFTRAITACLEAYDEAEDPAPGEVQREPSYDPHLDMDAFRGLLSNSEQFAHAVAAYVRSARSRGLAVEEAFANVMRIADDGGDEGASRSIPLVIRGLVLAAYGDDLDDAGVRATPTAELPSPARA